MLRESVPVSKDLSAERPQLSLLDVKEKYTRHAGVSTNEADFM